MKIFMCICMQFICSCMKGFCGLVWGLFFFLLSYKVALPGRVSPSEPWQQELPAWGSPHLPLSVRPGPPGHRSPPVRPLPLRPPPHLTPSPAAQQRRWPAPSPARAPPAEGTHQGWAAVWIFRFFFFFFLRLQVRTNNYWNSVVRKLNRFHTSWILNVEAEGLRNMHPNNVTYVWCMALGELPLGLLQESGYNTNLSDLSTIDLWNYKLQVKLQVKTIGKTLKSVPRQAPASVPQAVRQGGELFFPGMAASSLLCCRPHPHCLHGAWGSEGRLSSAWCLYWINASASL